MSLPRIPLADRERWRREGGSRARHAELFATLGFADEVEVSPPPAPVEPTALTVAAWNAERGRFPESSADRLRSLDVDILLLSEMDLGCARSGNRDTTRALAEALGLGSGFAVEFLELGLGGPEERARCAGLRNEIGYHGGGFLTRLPIEAVRAVRLESRGDWFTDTNEPRIGGRIAVLARLRTGRGEIAVASVHLESNSDADDRATQFGITLDALDAFAPDLPALVGGDLNTSSLGGAQIHDRALQRKAFSEDPERFSNPVPWEPLFARAEAAGFDWRDANVLGEATHRWNTEGGTRRSPLHLDWLFTRGLTCSEARTVEALAPDGSALSDHEILVARAQLPVIS